MKDEYKKQAVKDLRRTGMTGANARRILTSGGWAAKAVVQILESLYDRGIPPFGDEFPPNRTGKGSKY